MTFLACKTLSNLGVSPLLVFIATYSVFSYVVKLLVQTWSICLYHTLLAKGCRNTHTQYLYIYIEREILQFPIVEMNVITKYILEFFKG